MKTEQEIREAIYRLAAAQLQITLDKITDETVVPDINKLVSDATNGGLFQCGLNISTVGDAVRYIIAFS